MKKLLLFDFDGTVTDNSEGIFNCINYATDKMGLARVDSETIRRFVGPSLFDSFMRYCENNEERAQEFVNNYRERYAPVGTTEAKLYPGIKDALITLKAKGFRLAVCSGKPRDFVMKISKMLGVFELFEEYYCPGFATHSSTKSDYILEACLNTGIAPEHTLMIGDTVFDIRSAKEAGVESLGVKWGFANEGELEAEKTDYICTSPDRLSDDIIKLDVEKTHFVVFCAGEYGYTPAVPEGSVVFAADAGIEKCHELGIVPDLAIGDFDSLGRTPENAKSIVTLPEEKDDTDSLAAAKKAVEQGAKSIVFEGSLGGRLSHSLANISLIADLAKKGIKAELRGHGTRVTAICNFSAVFGRDEKGSVSVFAFSDECRGVTERGLKYSLEKATLKNTFALGVSNEFTGQPSYVSVEDGILVIVRENSY